MNEKYRSGLAVAAALFLLSLELCAQTVSFSDSFTTNSLVSSGHYVEFGPGVKVSNGVLSLTAGKRATEKPRLNIIPAIGRNGEFSFKARWVSGAQAWLGILADWRYHEMSPYVQMYALFEWNLVRFSGGTNATAGVAFEKGRWYLFSVSRSGDDITLSVDGEKLLSTRIPSKAENINATSSDASWGGFQLSLDPNPGDAVVEIDDLSVTGTPSAVDLRTMSRKFTLGTDKNYRFSVIYEAGYEDWATEAIAMTIPYYQFLTRVMGVPPLQRRLGLVQARGKYYEPGNGYNSQGVIIQKGAHKDSTGPGWSGWGVNCHEAAHSWQHLFAVSWATEGQADLACQLYSEKNSGVPVTAASVLREPFASEMRKTGKEIPCLLEGDGACPAGFKDGMPIPSPSPSKNIALAVVLYRLLGAEGYRQFHREALALGHGMSTAEFSALLEKTSGQSFAPILDGWLRPGTSTFPYIESVLDTDADGLSDLDERLFGCDRFKADSDGDGVSDLAEIRTGSSPLNALAPNPRGIYVDGLGEDWTAIATAATDPDDVAGVPDLLEVRWVTDNAAKRYLVRIDLAEVIGTTSENRPDIFISLDLQENKPDGTNVFRVNLFLRDLVKNIVDLPRWPALLNAGGVNLAVGNQNGRGFIEAEIPWAAVGNAGDMRLLVSAAGEVATDALNGAIVPQNVALPLAKKTFWRPLPIGQR